MAATQLPGVLLSQQERRSLPSALSDDQGSASTSSSSSSRSCSSSASTSDEEAAALRRQRRIASGRMRAVKLAMKSDVIEQTEDIEIFVHSPNTAMRKRRSKKRDTVISMGSAPVCARFGIRRVASAPAGWPGLLPVCEAFEESQEEFATGVMRRASEHTMWANLKHLAHKQKFRSTLCEEFSPTRRVRERKQVQAAAQGFTMTWGKTVDLFEQNMTLRPPTKRHSIAIGDLRAYSPATPLSAASPMKRHSLDSSRSLYSASVASPASRALSDASSLHPLQDEARPA